MKIGDCVEVLTGVHAGRRGQLLRVMVREGQTRLHIKAVVSIGEKQTIIIPASGIRVVPGAFPNKNQAKKGTNEDQESGSSKL